MPPVIVLDDHSDSDSSGTVENDPDQGYFLHEETPEEIDLTTDAFDEGDYLTDDCFQRLIRDWRPAVPTSTALSPPAPAPEPPPPKRIIPEACVDGILYRPGQSVELHDDSFLRIETVREDDTGVFLHGRRLVRAYLHPGTYIPPWRNEVIWTVDEDHRDLPLVIVKRFVPLVFTNWYQPQQAPTALLYCRVKETRAAGAGTGAVQYLSPDDADEGYRVSPAAMRDDWRGPTRRFGDADEARCPVVVDLDGVDAAVVDLTDEGQRRYTFGDGFCGAGGVSAGASQAGLSVKWAFDHSSHATTTYRLNHHPTAVCEQSDVFSFLTNDPAVLRVDVSHGSPPCQTFSPAHTIDCATDDANSACIFSCADLIRKAKPRMHTMEETSGLFERHQEVFFRVIQDFLELGYSVRWGILNCMDYGVPQSRRRLIIIASGPGESLPSFPPPTHGLPGSGRRPLETINSIISNIPSNAPDHDVDGALTRGLRRARLPFDANQQARTVTCAGGEFNYHPSGQRGFTNREFASLQTFPMGYRFGAREIRKQIGNAVPPILARALYREVVRSLHDMDHRASEEYDPDGIFQ